jgi:hypothetical protein
MAAPVVGPCEPWNAVLCCDVTGVAQEVIDRSVIAATEVLWGLSGRQFGECSARGRPCRDDCLNGWQPWGDGVWGPWPYNAGHAQWFNITCGCVGECSCTRVCEFELPGAAASGIVRVSIDGVDLVPNVDYRLDNWRKVVRLGGECWPLCQDMTANDDEIGSWVVEWLYGAPVPELGNIAVGELACEFIKACTNNRCKLPQRVQSIVREGVTFTLLDPQDFFADGRTGLYFSDLFITTFNPSRLAAASAVWSPDVPNTMRVAGT